MNSIPAAMGKFWPCVGREKEEKEKEKKERKRKKKEDFLTID